jgi:cyclopropane-fatty-acyl-phospholipid synthase
MLKQVATTRFLETLEHARYGSMTVSTPDGKTRSVVAAEEGAHATMHIRDWRTIGSFAAKGDIGLAEAYRDGWWDSDDLTALMQFGLQNEQALQGYLYGSALSRLAARFLYLFSRNTLKGSRRNIHAHYDLGNEFYKLWLDESMTYSAALFDGEEESLTPAQHRKYDRMIDRLGANSGRLLEIGCGWGGLAERAIRKGDFDIKGITLSDEQHAFAQTRLGDQATIALEDYRHQEGKYEHIISIEMFEAVGEQYWSTYFEKVKALLHDKGKAVVQTITIGEPYFERYRKGGDMIRSFIFPGGMLPSPRRFNQEAERAGLKTTDQFAFGEDYAQTLLHWLHNFEAKLPEVRALGFDERFIRIWRFYLAACAASFKVGRTDVMQMELQHA